MNLVGALGGLVGVVVVVVLVWLIVRLTKRTEGEAATPMVGAPGWYRQPDGSMRWWDGADWSEPDETS